MAPRLLACPPAASVIGSRAVRRQDPLAIAALVAVWAAAVVLVDPRADVPIIDDWTYAESVERLVHGAGFAVSPWSSTFPAAQIWWGMLFAWAGGFSFTALRASTLVLWLAATLATYGVARGLGCRPAVAVLGALALFSYPVMFVLAFSFMTDVPFAAASAASLLGLTSGLRARRLGVIAIGLGAAVVAFFVRPVAIALPAGLLLGALALDDRGLRRRAMLLAIATVAVMAVASAIAARFFPLAGEGGVAYRVERLRYVLFISPRIYLEAAFSMLAHVGLAIAPLLVALGARPSRRVQWAGAALVAAAVVVSRVAATEVSALKWSHTMSVGELGAARPLLQGALPPGAIGTAVERIATVIGLMAAAELLGRLARGLRAGGWLRTPAAACVAGFGIASAGLCFVLWFFYDRYYLPLVLTAALLALPDARAPRGAAAAVVFGALAVLDVTGTRDMLAYARVVSATAAELRAAGVAEIALDAGYPENGWRLYSHPERMPPGSVLARDVPHVTASAEGIPWVIANSVLPGYRVEREVPVPTWWASTDRIYVLHAAPPARAD
jgi:hypothetical protein